MWQRQCQGRDQSYCKCDARSICASPGPSLHWPRRQLLWRIHLVLQCGAVSCSELQCVAVVGVCSDFGESAWWIMRSGTATHCNTLQHTTLHWNTLHHTVTPYNTLRHTIPHCNTLHHTATHDTTLQHTAWWGC